MAYFPFFVDLEGRHGLIVGGGRVALRKAEKLLPFGPGLTVVAPEILPELAALPAVRPVRRAFAPGDITPDLAFVIAASDDRARNHQIALLCRERGIPVNAVDTPEDCSFLFPALAQSGPLSVGVSTGGASPTAAVWVKERVQALLPERFGDILTWLAERREPLRRRFPEEAARADILKRLFAACLERGRPLTEAELTEILEGY
nr:bifunctional precorrin-2 dehydrogenase/sirohydrochlorin ferrochelatase [uncultured Oscillibacter sp.]